MKIEISKEALELINSKGNGAFTISMVAVRG